MHKRYLGLHSITTLANMSQKMECAVFCVLRFCVLRFCVLCLCLCVL